ncbi:MAG: hypothetical protein JF589_10305 [Gemmatimonadetes bacterium]|nr:hypothetical protein [Gemmatimonadota bacterium]
MSTSLRLARSATLVAGVFSIMAAAPAGAQRRTPRTGVAAPPAPTSTIPRIPSSQPIATIPNGVFDSRSLVIPRRVNPRIRNNGLVNQRFQKRFRGNQVVYVPVGGYGCCDGYYGGYPSVYDANGVPLSASFGPGTEEPPPPSVTYNGYSAGAGYTPDLTGSPYVITNEGMMTVDFNSGERRAFPSCAAQGDLRDPRGRPRTIFYRQTDYWMILKPGQQGRVQGDPPAVNVKACYAIDSMGNVVLRQ